jgi:hypothetical protein
MSRVDKIMGQLEMMKLDLARQETTEQKNIFRGLMKALIGRIPEAKRLDEIEYKLDDMKKELDVTSNPEAQKTIMRKMRQIAKSAHQEKQGETSAMIEKEDIVDLSNAKPADKICCPFALEKVETKMLLQSEPPVFKKPRKERTVKKPRKKIIIIEDSDDDSVPIAQLKVKKTKVTKVTKTTKTTKKMDVS